MLFSPPSLLINQTRKNNVFKGIKGSQNSDFFSLSFSRYLWETILYDDFFCIQQKTVNIRHAIEMTRVVMVVAVKTLAQDTGDWMPDPLRLT